MEKKSKFISTVRPVTCEQEALDFLQEMRSKYSDATHNVYAYVLSSGTARFSDDGEPHGTAGKPILDVITGSGVTNVLITVTRYFGGVLLGTGGLVRAYSTSARDALMSAQRVLMCACTQFDICCDYGNFDRLTRLISECGGMIQNTNFTDKVEIDFIFKDTDRDAFLAKLCETFASKLEANEKNKLFFPFKI